MLAHAAELAVDGADRLLQSPLEWPAIINLNTPDGAPEAIRGLVEAPMTHIRYTDAFDRMERTGDHAAYWLKGEIIEESCTPGGDLERLLAGFATISTLGWNLTLPGVCDKLLQDND